MNSTARGPRSRWVGPPVPAPKSKLSRSPFGRQRHYGAVELAGVGEQVNVNDVVEVTDNAQQHQETSKRHPVLVQVLSMWEDSFTGVFKFRARWLVHASDLPGDALPRFSASRQTPAGDRSVTGGKTLSNKDQAEANEIFLTSRVKDLEVRFIVKPITLCVSTSATTEVSPGKEGTMGPHLTHAFCDKSGGFHPLEGTDPILKRARVRQANAVALASRADQENEAAKSGKLNTKSNGWLLPKRGACQLRGGRDGGRGAGGRVEVVASSSNSTGGPLNPPDIEFEASDDSGTDQPPNSEDGEWMEGEEDEGNDATDSDSSRSSKPTCCVSEGSKPRKSVRQRKSQRSPVSDAAPTSDTALAPDADVGHSSKAKVEHYSEAQTEDSSEAQADDCSDMQLDDSSEGQAEDVSDAHSEDFPEAQVELCSKAAVNECPEAKVCPPSSTSAPTFQRCRRVASNMRQAPLPPRPRRLAIPPMAEGPLVAQLYEVPPGASAKLSVAVKTARPVRTRMSMGLRSKSIPALPHSASMEDVGKASPQLPHTSKRKRSGAAKTTQGVSRSDYPPLRTPVGKDYQTDIPDMLSAEERKKPYTGTGAKMVWRSIQDWDPQSRGMLTGYLDAAKWVVEAKQARPGVAVHVRLGGKKGSSGVDKNNNTGIAGSYAVWAISSGREARELVRVACSEMAQTDVPKSAIQRVQSQEQALSALVKAKCVLDNFEPALEMLASDPGWPESIEPWTIKQVRTLEKALANDYDPTRRLHGWARPGMDMDREDFIDLATVSEQVPGKTPAQEVNRSGTADPQTCNPYRGMTQPAYNIQSNRYLAAAEPLTDVVYGPEAAKARKQESISPVHEADPVLPGNSRSPRGIVHTTKSKTPFRQASPELRNVSPAATPTNTTEPTPKPKPRVIRLSAPKPVESVVSNSEPNDGTTVDSVPEDDRFRKRDDFPPADAKVPPTPEATPTPPPPIVRKHAIPGGIPGGDDYPAGVDCGARRKSNGLGKEGGDRGGADEQFIEQRRCEVREREVSRILRVSGGDDHPAEGDRGTDREAYRRDDEGEGRGGASDQFSQQRRCAAREREVARTLPPIPPDAEVLEVEASDDADAGGATHNSGQWATGGGEPTRPSDMNAVARRINLMGSAELSWATRQMHRQAAPPAEAPETSPSGVLPVPPTSTPRHSDVIERQRKRDSDAARFGYSSEEPGFPNAQRQQRWERPPMSHPIRHEVNVRRFDDQRSGTQIEVIPSSGACGLGYVSQTNGGMGSEPASTDDMFGSMAPCWRLLERARAYMDKDQLEYMRGLVLTHVRKPMSRDQLLERAESCLQEQEQIFAAFVKMFDRIDQPPQVPLYPTTRALHPRPQSTSHSVRRLPDAGPMRTSSNASPPPHIPPPRTFYAQESDPYSLRRVYDGGARGVPTTSPSQAYPRVAVPASGRVEVQRSTHLYGRNGAGGWRASGIGNRGTNDAVGIRHEIPPRRLSPGPHRSGVRGNPARYQEGRFDTEDGGRSWMRNDWSQQPPGGWDTETAPSAVPAAAIPGSTSRRGSIGRAWGGGGAGGWS